MRLLRLQDVEISPKELVFRHARLRALIVWLAGFFATAALFFKALTHKWPPGYIFGSFLLLFLLLTLRFVTARFHPSNWLARMNETGIYVQYRSYLNYQLPADDPSVFFLSFGEIASARLIKERVETPDPAKPGATQTQYLRHIERGALRSFLGETQYVSLLFGGTLAIVGYWVGQLIGRYLAVWPIGRYIKTI